MDAYPILGEPNLDQQFLQIVPVRIVSAFESFFRETIGGLIDSGEDFLNNAKSLIKKNGVKFEFEDIFHLTKSKFTIGDLISYSLKYSAFPTIIKNYNEISQIDFLTEIDNFVNSIKNEDLEPLLIKERDFDKGRMITNINYIYEVRNVICHDFQFTRNRLSLDNERIRECLLDCCLLLEFGYIISSDLLFMPTSKKREAEIAKVISEQKGEIKSLLDKLQSHFRTNEQLINLEKDILTFEKYKDTNSNLLATQFRSNGSYLDSSLIEYERLHLESRIALLKEYVAGL